jgi:hypothetical protein
MLLLSQTRRRQPPTSVGVRQQAVNEFALSSVYVPWSFYSKDLLINERATPGGDFVQPSFAFGPAGAALVPGIIGTGSRVDVAADADSVLETDRCSLLIFHRNRDTTSRQAWIAGYIASSTDEVNVQPWSDGNIYWNFGNETDGSGRTSATYAKTLAPEVLIFVAGPRKGREIWQNGRKLVGNTGATAIRPATGEPWSVGGCKSGFRVTDNNEIYLQVVSRREWTDAEIGLLSANPWAMFTSQVRLYVDAIAGGTIYAGSIAETGAAADTVGGVLTLAGSASETGSAADTVGGAAVKIGGIAETGSAADTVGGAAVKIGGIAEAGTLLDTAGGALVLTGAVAETGSAADTVGGAPHLPGSVAETGSLADTVAGALALAGSTAETGSAADTAGAALVFTAGIAEIGVLLDTAGALLALVGTIAETAALADTVTADGVVVSSPGTAGLSDASATGLTASEAARGSVLLGNAAVGGTVTISDGPLAS